MFLFMNVESHKHWKVKECDDHLCIISRNEEREMKFQVALWSKPNSSIFFFFFEVETSHFALDVFLECLFLYFFLLVFEKWKRKKQKNHEKRIAINHSMRQPKKLCLYCFVGPFGKYWCYVDVLSPHIRVLCVCVFVQKRQHLFPSPLKSKFGIYRRTLLCWFTQLW